MFKLWKYKTKYHIRIEGEENPQPIRTFMAAIEYV